MNKGDMVPDRLSCIVGKKNEHDVSTVQKKNFKTGLYHFRQSTEACVVLLDKKVYRGGFEPACGHNIF